MRYVMILALLAVTRGSCAKVAMPATPYHGVGVRQIALAPRGGDVYRLHFTLVYKNGARVVMPVKHYFKALCTGAVEDTAKGRIGQHWCVDEGGNTTFECRTDVYAKSHRAGTVYANFFDWHGDLITSATFEVDANMKIVAGN